MKKKMKTTKIMLVGLSALVLAGCAKDRTAPNDNSKKSFLTVQFAVAAPTSKTDNSGAKLDGTPAESSVSNAVVYLVQSGQVKAILSVSSLNQVSHGGYDDGYESPVLETTVEPGTYDVYAYAGSSADPFGYSVGSSWNGTATQSFSPVAREGIANAGNTAANDNSFMMFSQNDASATGNTVPTVTITSANNKTSNPAVAETVYLDRLTAKVTASEDVSLTINSNVKSGDFAFATAELNGILPVSAAITMYIQQQWSDPAKLNLSTPSTDRYGMINGSFASAGETYADIQTSTGSYTSVAVSDLTGKVVPADKPLYILENLAESTPVWGSTTGVVFKVTLDATGSGTPATFFGYNKNSEHFLTLAALQSNYPNAFDVFGNTNPDGTDNDAQNLADAEALLSSDVAAFRAQTKINVFEDGVMYYTYFIKDANYNNYGIYRNTWYQLQVTEITNFGDDIPGGWNPDDPTVNPDPTTPVEDDKLYIKVKLLVNKWVASVTTIHLGE